MMKLVRDGTDSAHSPRVSTDLSITKELNMTILNVLSEIFFSVSIDRKETDLRSEQYSKASVLMHCSFAGKPFSPILIPLNVSSSINIRLLFVSNVDTVMPQIYPFSPIIVYGERNSSLTQILLKTLDGKEDNY